MNMTPRRFAFTLVLLSLVIPLVVLAQENPVARSQELYRESLDARQEGDFETMRARLAEAVALRPHHPTLIYKLAAAHALAGDTAGTLQWLDLLARMGIHTDPALDEDFAGVIEDESLDGVLSRLEANGQPVGESEFAFDLPDEPAFIPEGIALDPQSFHFYLGSVRESRIMKLGVGTGEPFADAGSGLWSVFGMRVDPARRHLWVATTACKETAYADSADWGRAAVIQFDLESGDVLKRFVTPPGEDHFFGDLVLDEAGGIVYVSDSRGSVYRILPGGDLEVFVPPGRFASPQGIALSRDRAALFLADYAHGVFRIPLDTREPVLMPYPDDATLLGIDGLYARANTLIAIQNGIRPHRIVRLILNAEHDAVDRVQVAEANHPGWDEPTLGVLVGGLFFYVANSQWGKFDEAGNLPAWDELADPIIMKTRF
jgi:hypothetical protein